MWQNQFIAEEPLIYIHVHSYFSYMAKETNW